MSDKKVIKVKKRVKKEESSTSSTSSEETSHSSEHEQGHDPDSDVFGSANDEQADSITAVEMKPPPKSTVVVDVITKEPMQPKIEAAPKESNVIELPADCVMFPWEELDRRLKDDGPNVIAAQKSPVRAVALPNATVVDFVCELRVHNEHECSRASV
jgi:hypothetical protein